MNVDSLDWPMLVLATVGADFTVESPPELAEAVSRAAERFGRSDLTRDRMTNPCRCGDTVGGYR